MSSDTSIHDALRDFAAAVTAKTSQLTAGEPEDQLRAPFERFMTEVAAALDWNVVCTGETPLPDRLGRPDYAVHRNGLLVGYVEIKAPGTGANAARFTGRNRRQFDRFSAIPNLLYTDGNEWALYRQGERVHDVVRLSGDVAGDGKRAAAAADARGIERLMRDFLSWEPLPPLDGKGRIDLKRFADLLAPLCRMLRDDVTDALADPDSPLVDLATDWRQLLFPHASDPQFADAYAQTVAFALLLGRSEGADPLTLDRAHEALAAQHSLLSSALQVLTDPKARTDMSASLDLLRRVIAVVSPTALTGPQDPWLYFYEDFLATYDPKLRKDAGAYYTPIEVVRAQVRLVDDLLVSRLNKPLGFADTGVVTLDPAAGTGTYLLGVIEHALGRVEAEQGAAGAVAGQATELARNLYGFEVMVGPYAVSELRVSRALRDRGAPSTSAARVYLTDTLESPHAEPPQLRGFLRPISDQRRQALEVKKDAPVLVCLGNPPYDRHGAVDWNTEDNLSRYGGWVRFGDPLDVGGTDKTGMRSAGKTPKARLARRQELSILKDFLEPAKRAGHGVYLKNIYNLYVYFWRWALWKVFEHDTANGPGIVSFITASSYLDGDAFRGMREHIRRVCDEVWILDLGGEGHGTHKSDNVFAIQTPVTIAVAVRTNEAGDGTPANVHYARIEGTREEKLAALDAIGHLEDVDWHDCPDAWQAPFRPVGTGGYFTWPLLTDLMPWQHSGVQLKRMWPIAPDEETLERRWDGLLQAADRSEAFRETGDRTIAGTYRASLTKEHASEPIAELSQGTPVPEVQRYAYRSFDRQHLLADGRLISRPRPDLWRAHSNRQVYVTSLLSQVLGDGPAITACALIPDLHHFPGGSGKSIVPLYRNADASEVNVPSGLLDELSREYGRQVTAEDFLAYAYGALAQPAFTARFAEELETRDVRVPLTKDAGLFEHVRTAGARLLWLHTYGQRFVPEGARRGQVQRGATKCTKAVPGDADGYPEAFHYDDETQTLHVGAGEFAPVTPALYGFEVSGLKVVQSWLYYRMKKGAGKKSSPLDDIRPARWTGQFTTELLELLWVLEATLASYPEQARLLDAVIDGPCFRADDLPPVPEAMRKPPGEPAVVESLL